VLRAWELGLSLTVAGPTVGALCECLCRLVSLTECGLCLCGLSYIQANIGRLFIAPPFVSITHHQLSLTLSSPTGQSQLEPSCPLPTPLSLPHQPPIPTFPPFSTLPWKNTTARLSKTSPSIPSFPGFNPVNPPRQSSPSFEGKPPSSINHRIATMDSRIG
jgi:hypothetical protein